MRRVHLTLAGFGAVMLAATAAGAAPPSVYVGNDLNPVMDPGAYPAPDGDPPLVILDELGPSGPLSTGAVFADAGAVTSVQFSSASGVGYDFTVYALASEGAVGDVQQFKVDASESFSGNADPGVSTLAAHGFTVAAGDVLAFVGVGPDYPNGVNQTGPLLDGAYGNGGYDAAPLGPNGTTFTVGEPGDPAPDYTTFPYGRTYAFGVNYTPGATATVPEPEAWALMILGLGGLGSAARARRRSAMASA